MSDNDTLAPDPDEEIVTVATYQSLPEADLARAELEMAGIRAFVANATMTQSFVGMPETGIALQVAEDDAAQAQEILSGRADASTSDAELYRQASETSEDAPVEPGM